VTARALLIGVGETSFLSGQLPALPGVADDVRAVSQQLAKADIEVHTPTARDDVTAAGVARLLAELVDRTKAGDLAVMYLSGHGYRYRDASGDETDGWDEAFVCSDGPLEDDWFRAQLWPRARAGARFVAIVDACHSSSAVLGLRVDDRPVAALTTRIPDSPGYYRIVLAACRDYETTIDVGRSDDGGGVATREMIALLREQRSLTYRSLWQQVAKNVRDRYPSRRVGTPRMDSFGPDDSLLDAIPFNNAA
jgi:hypothetical protein